MSSNRPAVPLVAPSGAATNLGRAGEVPSRQDVDAAGAISEAWGDWMERFGYPRDTPIGNQYAAALEAIEALRQLPVDQRMEAMGMLPNRASFDGGMTWEDVWTE